MDSGYVAFVTINGLAEGFVVWERRLKNTAIPVVAFPRFMLTRLLNGSVAVEVVFAWPGIGRLMLEGISRRDFPIIQATVMAAGIFYIVTALLVDILYTYVNPRIRFQ